MHFSVFNFYVLDPMFTPFVWCAPTHQRKMPLSQSVQYQRNSWPSTRDFPRSVWVAYFPALKGLRNVSVLEQVWEYSSVKHKTASAANTWISKTINVDFRKQTQSLTEIAPTLKIHCKSFLFAWITSAASTPLTENSSSLQQRYHSSYYLNKVVLNFTFLDEP